MLSRSPASPSSSRHGFPEHICRFSATSTCRSRLPTSSALCCLLGSCRCLVSQKGVCLDGIDGFLTRASLGMLWDSYVLCQSCCEGKLESQKYCVLSFSGPCGRS